MSDNTKLQKLNMAIKETGSLLEKAITAYENSLRYLEMEKKENLELGNDESANQHAIEYVKEKEERVIELENHIAKLEGMIESINQS